jgi:hypothetical protein
LSQLCDHLWYLVPGLSMKQELHLPDSISVVVGKLTLVFLVWSFPRNVVFRHFFIFSSLHLCLVSLPYHILPQDWLRNLAEIASLELVKRQVSLIRMSCALKVELAVCCILQVIPLCQGQWSVEYVVQCDSTGLLNRPASLGSSAVSHVGSLSQRWWNDKLAVKEGNYLFWNVIKEQVRKHMYYKICALITLINLLFLLF